MIRFLADESFPDPTAELIKSWGFAVTKVRELGLSGAKDPVIFQKAQEKNLILLTADKGFGDIRVYPPSLHAGVILSYSVSIHRILRKTCDRYTRC